MRFKKKNLFWLAFISLLTMGTPAYAATSYTTADVAQHNTAGDCWVNIGGGVYDLTSVVVWHPNVITCGANMTSLYLGKHTTLNNVNPYYLGNLVPIVIPPVPVVNVTNTTVPGTNTTNNTTIPTNTTSGNTTVDTGNSTNPTNTSVPVANSTNTSLVQYAPSVVLVHNSSDDCWVSVFGKIYDVTPVMPTYGYFYTCGIDNTQAWQASIFGNDTSIMTPFYIGNVMVNIPPIETNTTTNTSVPTNTTTNTNTTLPQGNNTNNTNTTGQHSRPSREDRDDDESDEADEDGNEVTHQDRSELKEQRRQDKEAAKDAREDAREIQKQSREQAREQAKATAEQAREERTVATADKPEKRSNRGREDND